MVNNICDADFKELSHFIFRDVSIPENLERGGLKIVAKAHIYSTQQVNIRSKDPVLEKKKKSNRKRGWAAANTASL